MSSGLPKSHADNPESVHGPGLVAYGDEVMQIFAPRSLSMKYKDMKRSVIVSSVHIQAVPATIIIYLFMFQF